ncbi:hypothetical protein BJX70DRAFT_398539 [Aspergillus crustosus]
MSSLPPRQDVSTRTVKPLLSQMVGYIVVVLLGVIIALVMMLVTKVLKKTTGEDNKKTEMFMTANRTVRTGLTASAVVSSWLWSTALLGSSFTGYNYGVSDPFWFAAGCSPMIVFFALLGISCKRKVPEAHTSLEVVRIRYGRVAHIVFMVLCLVNNIFASANMLLGASAVISAMSGMHIIASTFLLPVRVTVYTFVGGIKATFLTDYFHTTIILIIACYFSVKAFQSDQIGSIGNLYDLLKDAASQHPVPGNQAGSYLTMTSRDGILFGILHICSNFGLVIRMTPSEVSSGLVLPYAAITLAGKGGAAAIQLMIFMAVTSTLSAQVIAVSSILSFDVYREYFNKDATDRDVIRVSHLGVVVIAVFAAAFSTMLHYVGVDLGWTLYMLAPPKQARCNPLTTPRPYHGPHSLARNSKPFRGGDLSVATTGQVLPCVYGTVASCFSPIVSSVGITLVKSQEYDWGEFQGEKLALGKVEGLVVVQEDEHGYGQRSARVGEAQTGNIEVGAGAGAHTALDTYELKRWGRIAAFWSAAMFLGHWVLWPLPMYGSHYVFGKKFYIAWVVVGIIWLWATLLVATLYPILDGGYQQILQVYHGLRGQSSSSSSPSPSEVDKGQPSSGSGGSFSGADEGDRESKEGGKTQS